MIIQPFLAAAILASAQHATRNYDGRGTNYVAEFTYDDSVANVPLTNPPGQPHYQATFDLYRIIEGGRLLIAQTVPGIYTPNGCSEDSLESLFYAIAQQSPATVANNPVSKIGAAIHFAPMTTLSGSVVTNLNNSSNYVTLTNMLYCTRNVVPPEINPVTTNLLDFTVPLTFIVDWYLQSEWLLDPSTNIDSATHYDTNVLSTNLVAKLYYRQLTNWIVLEQRPVTNIIHSWHWSTTKVYDN